jgi:formate hydrogenlyase transcriptional activator
MTQVDDSLRAALEDRLRFETIIADLSAQFVNLDSDLIDGAIQDAQRRIVEALDLDRSTLFQFSEDRSALVFTHYWSRPEFAAVPALVDPSRLFPGSRSGFCAARWCRFAA